MTIKPSPLNSLSLRDISRLIFERTRFREHKSQATDLDPNRYRDKANIFIHLVETRGAKEETVQDFHRNAKEFSRVANDLLSQLKVLGLKDNSISKAWSKIEKISDEVRSLVDLSTNGNTVKDFGRKFVEIGNTLSKLVFRDIILDEKIDKLGIE